MSYPENITRSRIFQAAQRRLTPEELDIFVVEFEAAVAQNISNPSVWGTPGGWAQSHLSEAFDWENTPQHLTVPEERRANISNNWWYGMHTRLHGSNSTAAQLASPLPSGAVDVKGYKYRYPEPIGPKDRMRIPRIPL